LLATGTVLQYQCLALPDGGRMLTYFDISVLKHREEELAEAVHQKDSALSELQAVLDTIDYGVVFADADLRVRIANQAFREMWDIPESLTSQRPTIRELLDFHRGRSVHDVSEGEWEAYADERLREIRSGHIPRSEMRTVSGKTFIYQCVALPDGVRMLTYFEITQLKRTEEALRESEERYSPAMRGANEGLWDWKADTNQIVVSPRFLEIMSLPSDKLSIALDDWYHIIHTDDFATHHDALIAHLRGEREYYDTEFRVKRPDGSYRWIQNRGIGLRDDAGRVYRMAGSVSDVDARKRAEFALLDAKEKAEQASRVKSQFLANMSHELRTPLNAVIGITEMLREDAEDQGDKELFEPLERVSRAGKHLLNLINDILDISKIEAGRLELLLEHADLAGLLQDAVNTAQPLAAQNRNELQISLSPGLGTVYVDPVRLRQIILNLISNACKFTKSGTVTLSARRLEAETGEIIELSVADTGIGIAPEFLDSLFQEFTQVDASATRRYGGTGLGLAICRRLAQLMGGEIRVDSTLGEGTTFTVHMPVEIQAPRTEIADVSLAH
jgi:PAS domain S-box-containing protein